MFDDILGFFGVGDDEEDDGGYQTSIRDDLDINNDGNIGTKPIASYEADTTYDNGGGFWDSVGDIFTDRRILGPALETGMKLVGGAFQQSAQEKAVERAREDKKKQALMELELEKLKYKYGLTGGKGGGGGGGQRGAQLLSAYQNYINGVANISASREQALGNLGNTISSAYARRA